MENENQRQKEFVESIQLSLDKANALCGDLITASRITPPDPVAVQQYLASLQAFINAGQKMILEMNLFFGEDSETIGTWFSGLIAREPTLLN